jgi:tetratricopeptide (TPR) repeat protein
MWQRAEGGRLSPSFVEMLAGRLGRPMPAREVAWSRERFEGDLRTVNELAGKGQSEQALDAAHTLLEHIQTAGYSEAGHDEAVVRLARAGLLQQTGAIENALGDVRQALAEFRKSGDTHMAAVALSKEGECLLAMARYDEAVRSFEESIRLSEQLRELGGPAQGRYRLATVWMAQGRFAQALEVATHALELFRRQGDLPSIANGLSLTGTIYESLKRYEDAIKAYRESIDISAKTGDLTAQATGAERLGSLYALLRNPRDAERSYRQAGSLFASSGDPMRQSKVLSSLAELLFRQRRFDEARVELGQVLYLQAPLGHAAEPWRAYRLLSEVEKAAGDHGAGFRALAQAVTLYRDYRKEGGTPQPDFENLEPPAGASAMA